MSNSTLISVLMPVYNAGKYLREAIDSILNQTYKEFEFVIVDDGSTDDSVSIINSYKDERIKLVSQKNGGVSAALNTGLAHCSGKYIARFDADDICYPDRLEVQLIFITTHPEYVLIGSNADYVTESGEFVFTFESSGHTHEEIEARIYDRNPFIHSVVLFPKDVILKCGGYDPRAHTFEDHLLWVKVIRMGKVCNFDRSLVKVRINAASVTTDERLRGKKFLALRKKILESNEPVSADEEQQLLETIRSQNSLQIKKLGYHLFVAKKYLWNNYKPSLARRHLAASIKLKPLAPESFLLFGLSFFPKRLICKVYQLLKENER